MAQKKVSLEDAKYAKQMKAYKKKVIEPKGVNFNKQQTEYQLFPEEYFTGADCYIYFNDVWMDEITNLSFSLTELVDPQWGYASNTWDYVARGKRFVKGQFRIAFKEAGYMFVILDHIGKLGNTKKTALSWLLNDSERDLYGDGKYRGIDGVPDGYMDVLERIETGLQRIYGDKSAKAPTTTTYKEEEYLKPFLWDVPLKYGSSNKVMKDPTTKQPQKRTTKGYTKQIDQLQQRLIDLGYGFKAWDPGWSKHYGGELSSVSRSNRQFFIDWWKHKTGSKANKFTPTSGDWYVGVRYWTESTTFKGRSGKKHNSMIPGYTVVSRMVKQLQKRLLEYPGGLDTYWTGDSRITNLAERKRHLNAQDSYALDGRYGDGPQKAIKKFMKLAGYDDGSDGFWVSQKTYSTLKLGLKVTGKYDVATRMAVWYFQKAKGLKTTGYVDAATKKALATKAKRKVKVVTPGENRYNIGETAEPLYAVYEKEVWGRPFVDRAEDVRKQDSFFYRSRRSDKLGVHLKSLYQEGFDIYINYGPFPQYVQANANKINDTASFNTTVKAIRNIQLTDVQQVLDAKTGEPIEEIYSFIAKDLD